jgi:hypothetical protein
MHIGRANAAEHRDVCERPTPNRFSSLRFETQLIEAITDELTHLGDGAWLEDDVAYADPLTLLRMRAVSFLP